MVAELIELMSCCAMLEEPIQAFSSFGNTKGAELETDTQLNLILLSTLFEILKHTIIHF